MDSGADPIDLLLEQHGALADLFASHQEALLDRRWTEAARLLEDYDSEEKALFGELCAELPGVARSALVTELTASEPH